MNKTTKYSPKMKKKILEKLDRERRERQKIEYLKSEQYGVKKIYNMENKEFFKILGMDRDYYIQVEDFLYQSPSPEILTLYYSGFDGLLESEALVKFTGNTSTILISEDMVRAYFKTFLLEENE